MGSKVMLLFWIDMNHYLNSKGFRLSYGRCSNPKTHYLLTTHFGAEFMSKTKMVHEDKELTLTFVRYPLRPMNEHQGLSDKFKVQAKL
jgi:hypothetical protein